MRVEKPIIQTSASQFSTTLVWANSCSRLTRTWQLRLSYKLSLVNSHHLTLVQLLFSLDHDMRVKETLIQTVGCQLSCNSPKNSRFLKALVYFPQHSCSFKLNFDISISLAGLWKISTFENVCSRFYICKILPRRTGESWRCERVHFKASSIFNVKKRFFTLGKTRLLAFDYPSFCEIWTKIEQIRIKWKRPTKIVYLLSR